MQNTSSNKQIARNTIMLYIRMFFSMLIGLYTSRIVLQVLGFEDYGIYSVVGGIVSMMGFLNASMSGATSRFLTFELGKDSSERLKDTFSSALIIHIIIALLILIIGEVLGNWLLHYKLVIPESRMAAAYWVLHLSLFSAAVTIIQTPYMASVMSHEKMDVYAYIEILNVVLKLVIVYLLIVGPYDKLIFYVCLLFGTTLIVFGIYRFYCRRFFPECTFHVVINKSILLPMLSFSGWDLYGNMGARIYQQGLAFIQNVFFGVTLNAAHGLAMTVQGVIQGLSGNVIAAFRPAMIKEYAKGNYEAVTRQFSMSIKITMILFMVAIVPAIHELDYLMKLWLGDVPPYAVQICQLLLYMSVIQQIQFTMNIIIHATGKINVLSFSAGSIFIFSILCAYVLYSLTNDPLSAYYLFFLLHLIIVGVDILIIKRQAPQVLVLPSMLRVVAPSVFMIVFGHFLIQYISSFLSEGFLRLLIVCILSFLFYSSASYFVLLNSDEKMFLKKYVEKIVYKNNSVKI